MGSTFAAMRPDLVKRMVLDGVVNAESYFNDALQWGRDAMDETHKVGCIVVPQCHFTNACFRHSLGFSRLVSTLVLSDALSQFPQTNPERPRP